MKKTIKKNFEFKKIFNNRNILANDTYKFFYDIKNNDINEFNYGITISKKIKGSIKRNYIKRQIRTFIQENKINLNIKLIIFIKENYLKNTYTYNKKKFKQLLHFLDKKIYDSRIIK